MTFIEGLTIFNTATGLTWMYTHIRDRAISMRELEERVVALAKEKPETMAKLARGMGWSDADMLAFLKKAQRNVARRAGR